MGYGILHSLLNMAIVSVCIKKILAKHEIMNTHAQDTIETFRFYIKQNTETLTFKTLHKTVRSGR